MNYFIFNFFIIACVKLSGSTGQENENMLNITDPDFPDISPWVPLLFMKDIRNDKVMPGNTKIVSNMKYIVNRPQNTDNLVSSSNHNEITETDMYLLSAIEKLAFKMENMEKRLRRTEELIFHLMEGSSIKRQDACPANFTRVSRNCYYFGERQLNWKSSASMCKSLGGNLIEIESRDEFMEVVTFIQATNYLRGFDFWTGGLNPGLLWIWANSARPVIQKNSSGTRPDERIYGTGRCLNLAINNAKLYEYHGSDCGIRFRYICEHEENSTIRALKRLQKSLIIKEE